MKFIKIFDRYIIALFFITIVIVTITSYFTFNEVIRSHHQHQNKVTIPLYSLITNELIRPLTISHYIANDQFLINYLQQDTIDVKPIAHYLQNLSAQYNMLAFLAVEKHNLMIDSTNKKTDLTSSAAEWFHRLKVKEQDQFADIGNAENPHLYFDMKIKDEKGKFLGFAGVAIDLDHFANTFSDIRDSFGFDLFVVDENSNITLTSNHLMKTDKHHWREETTNINDLPWFNSYKSQNSKGTSGSLFQFNGEDLIVTELQIPELQWKVYVVTPPVTKQSEYWRSFSGKLFIFVLIALILYFFLDTFLNYFKNRVVKDAESDFLTQLPNRGLVFWLYNELKEQAKSATVVMADIDHFKKVNDTYGHAIGDEVIKSVARQLKENLRSVDIIGRWGGEEFIMVLPKTSAKQAKDVIERIRENIASTPFACADQKTMFQVTVSFGMNEGNIRKQSLDDITLYADKALYQAKANGRNQVIIFEEES